MAYNFLKNSFLHIWPSLFIISVTLISVRIAYNLKNHDRTKFHEDFWHLISIIYMIMLYELVTRADVNYISGVNIVPFTEILRYSFHSKLFYFNVLGNIALFIPFGYIIASYIKPKKVWTNFFVGIIVSLTIELVQLKIGRSFDIDDIILNTLGCVIGFLIYIAVNAISNHLPRFLKSDWLKNLICIIITICVCLYILNVMGISVL